MAQAQVLMSAWSQYDARIIPLLEDLLALGILVEKQFLKATQCLLKRDTETAQEVIALYRNTRSSKIDIDKACIAVLETTGTQAYAPEINTIFKLGDNFLAIAGEAEKLALKTFQLQDMEQPRHEYELTWRFGENVCARLKDTSRAFAGLNEDVAKRILSFRLDMDEKYENSLRHLIAFMANQPRYIGLTLKVMSLTHCFAAVWEHICEVCELVIKLSRKNLGPVNTKTSHREKTST